ncbi:RING/U-box superfamily protein [Tasmannia lanceolata]|uniref:RING/U-box superfamily protein n=1 Tax=Tasmannia lanceolata TaxID=3420 RepID=UPI0040629030
MENEAESRVDVDLNLIPLSPPSLTESTNIDEEILGNYQHLFSERIRPNSRWRRRLGRLLFAPETPPPSEIQRISMDSLFNPLEEVRTQAGESSIGGGERSNVGSQSIVGSSGNGRELIASALGERVESRGGSGDGVSCFECNICLEMARDPVVTSCGHLFCWSCLYQWLHVHSDTQECPVCKGEVTEKNLTPIYGRGSEEKKVDEEEGELSFNFKTPPRPHAQRIESSRQRVHRGRLSWGIEDVTRRIRINSALLGASMETLERINASVDQIRNRLRVVQGLRRGDSDQGASNLGTGVFQNEANVRQGNLLSRGRDARMRVLSMLRRQRPNREASSSANVPPATNLVDPLVQTPHDGHLSPGDTQTLAVGGWAQQLSEHMLVDDRDRGSVSSTVAVVQSESPIQDTATGPHSVGSSSTRSARDDASGSLDVDGDVFLIPKRRRLN